MKVSALEQTFLDLVAIDEVYPHEHKVLEYITTRLNSAGVSYTKDEAGNIVATIPAATGLPLALVGHVDIAAPLSGRQVVIQPDVIKTDGTGLLGGDDKAAVAAMLELATAVAIKSLVPGRPVQLVFTTGEEAGCVGAVALDMNNITARQALVLDWTGRPNCVVTKSPAYVKIDIEYIGKAAHPAHWQDGKNAGAALIAAATKLKQGEYSPGVTCNIGIFNFGKARNQVPGRASLQAELRSHDKAALSKAVSQTKALFENVAGEYDIKPVLSFVQDSPAYVLDQSGVLFSRLTTAMSQIGLEPHLEATFGGFDGNILADRGIETIMIGAAFYNPHSVSEYLNRSEFHELFELVCQVVS
jgi:tripeptide aminopeptidase